jgi:hypothetical protein
MCFTISSGPVVFILYSSLLSLSKCFRKCNKLCLFNILSSAKHHKSILPPSCLKSSVLLLILVCAFTSCNLLKKFIKVFRPRKASCIAKLVYYAFLSPFYTSNFCVTIFICRTTKLGNFCVQQIMLKS